MHLIGNDQCTKFIRRSPDTAKIIIMRVSRATLALNRLDHHRGHMITQRIAKRVEIAERNVIEAGRHRSKAGPVGRLVGRRQHPERAPME